jgi:hypothetical protein
MRSLVLQKRNVQEFQFRQYLFAAQASAGTAAEHAVRFVSQPKTSRVVGNAQ